jgi:hypothetical protein
MDLGRICKHQQWFIYRINEDRFHEGVAIECVRFGLRLKILGNNIMSPFCATSCSTMLFMKIKYVFVVHIVSPHTNPRQYCRVVLVESRIALIVVVVPS